MAETVLAKMAVEISANAAKFNAVMGQMKGQLAGLESGLSKANNLFAAFGAGISVMAAYNAFKQVIGVLAEFESTMSEVKAITGATGTEFEKLKKSALDLGSSTKFSSVEVGKLQIALGRLGFNTDEILNATEATLALAAATGEDLAKAADVAGSTVRGFGLDAKETQKVVDVMAKSFNTTALGLDNFSEAMKYVAPIAAASNVSLEETTALLGTLADNGIRGSAAGTALRKILSDLPKNGKPFQERLQELAEKGIDVAGAMDEVGRTAQTALLVLAKNTDKTKALADSFHNVAGEAEAMARIMSDNLTGDIEKLSGAWEGLLLNFSKTDVFRKVTQDVTAMLDSIRGSTNADQAFRNLAQAIKSAASTSDIEHFTEKLKDARIEAGKPFNASGMAQEFGSKLQLTTEQTNQFYEAILSVNDAMGFQEKRIKQFTDFAKANHYKTLAEAAEVYKSNLYKLILAQQIEKSQNEKFVGVSDAATESIKARGEQINANIADYRRIIDLINQYVEANTIAAKKELPKVAPKEEIKAAADSLKGLQDQLAALSKAYDNTSGSDLRMLDVLSVQMEAVNVLIARLERLKALGAGELVLPTPDTKALHDALDIKGATDRFEADMKRIAESAKSTSVEIKEGIEGIDLGPVLASAMTGLGEALGEAMAGTQKLGKSLLGVFGGVLKQFGQLLITAGTGIIIAKKAFQSMNGYIAIAAGVALVALGAYFAASTKNLGTSMGSGGGGGGGGSSSSSGMTRFQNTSAPAQQIVLTGQFKASGRDLVLAIDNQNKAAQRGG